MHSSYGGHGGESQLPHCTRGSVSLSLYFSLFLSAEDKLSSIKLGGQGDSLMSAYTRGSVSDSLTGVRVLGFRVQGLPSFVSIHSSPPSESLGLYGVSGRDGIGRSAGSGTTTMTRSKM